MNIVRDLEKQILALPPADREQLATIAWESLFEDPQAAMNPQVDPEGIQTAAERDAELESGRAQPIDHTEFLRRTGRTKG